MAVTEAHQSLGGWGIALRPDTPRALIDKIKYFGHIAINSGIVDPRVAGDSMLTSSRYIGVVRKKVKSSDEAYAIGGPGMAMWLGDEDQKGDVFESVKTIANLTFEDTLRQLLPASGAITEGTFFNIGKNFSGSFQFVSPREAINYVTNTLGADWVVRGDGTLDAGLEADLFEVNPKAILLRKNQGIDMFTRGFEGGISTEQDVEDYTTRVVLLAQDETNSTVTATADINPALNPFKDLHGNAAKLTRLISETETDPANAPARAQLQLNRFSGTRDSIELSSTEYDLHGSAEVGDYLWVFDPEIDIVDSSNEIMFRGMRLNPLKLRLTERTWPVTAGSSVAYRDWNGNWVDLTPYIMPESGETTLVVGGYNRSLLADAAGGGAQTGSQPGPNLTVPAQVQWDTPFLLSTYQSHQGETRAQVELKWFRPDNTDLTPITDGSHYEVRWRSASTPLYAVTWAQLEGYTYAELEAMGGTWDNPVVFETGRWEYMFVSWEELSHVIQNLMPSMPYEAQIRAVDGAVPANYGEWSEISQFQTAADMVAPSTPAPPEVAASRIAVQIVHRLGRAEGGTYNLDADLHHFDIHGSIEEDFSPTPETLLGKISANNSMMIGRIPAVGTIPIEETVPVWFRAIAVDYNGNASPPSTAVQQSAQLIDDAHISDLSVSKVTAGTILSEWIIGAKIRTATSGARVEIDQAGIKAYNSSGILTSEVRSADGTMLAIGEIASGLSGTRIVLNERVSGVYIPEMRFYPSSGATYSYINAPNSGGVATIGMNSGQSNNRQMTVWLFHDTSKMAWTEFGTGTNKGGKVHVGPTWGSVGFEDVGVDEDAYFLVKGTRELLFKGYVPQGNPVASQPAVWFHGVQWSGGIITVSPGSTVFGVVWMAVNFSLLGAYNGAINCMGFDFSNSSQKAGTGVNGPSGRYGCVMFRTLSF